jgi:hypothetical protein
MNANDIRRFFSTGKLNESLTNKSTLETKSFTEAFDELSRLYEADEETTEPAEEKSTTEKPAEAKPGDEKTLSIDEIKKEVQKIEVPEASVKLEGKADELYDQLIAKLKESNLASAVEILELVAADPKLSLLLRHGFSNGSAEDATIGVNIETQTVPVANMRPTQKEIGTDGSLKNILTGKHAKGSVEYKDYFEGDAVASMPGPFVYKDGDTYYIIDGHHRWSQTYCLNPKTGLKCQVLTSSTKLTPSEVLKNFQAAIAADQARNSLGRKDFEGKNFFEFAKQASNVIEYLKDMGDEVAEKIATNANKVMAEDVKKAVETYGEQVKTENKNIKEAISWVTTNAVALAEAANADKNPTRYLMPQSDDNTFDIVKDTLAIGK